MLMGVMDVRAEPGNWVSGATGRRSVSAGRDRFPDLKRQVSVARIGLNQPFRPIFRIIPHISGSFRIEAPGERQEVKISGRVSTSLQLFACICTYWQTVIFYRRLTTIT